jgi:enoyl-CoA hydratase
MRLNVMIVRYELVDERCALITIDRPAARNAVDAAVARGIEEALDRAESDDKVRVAVITGAPPVFCAGADLKAIAAGQGAELSTDRGGFAGVVRRQRLTPLIAAVEGAALAGGMEIALACDLVVAADDARFAITEVKRGLIAAAGGLFRLGRKVPVNIAMEAALTGDPICAHDAHRYGLVNHLTESGQALESALALARSISANAPLAVRASRGVLLDCTDADDDTAWAATAKAFAEVADSEDAAEGVAAFNEKRRPVWSGR